MYENKAVTILLNFIKLHCQLTNINFAFYEWIVSLGINRKF